MFARFIRFHKRVPIDASIGVSDLAEANHPQLCFVNALLLYLKCPTKYNNLLSVDEPFCQCERLR